MQWLDSVPLWGIFLGTMTIVVISIETGYRLGRYRFASPDHEKDAPVGAIVAAILGLLAFLLAFCFSLAATRFDARRQVVVQEANAIGTAWLRAGMLPAPHGEEIRRLLREYVDVRLNAAQGGSLPEALNRSTALHDALWEQASQVAALDSRSVIAGLFIQSLNEVIDLHSTRVLVAVRSRVPMLVWFALYLITILAMTALGFQQGLSGSPRSLAVLALALAFAVVLVLIADLDRPQEGLLRVGQGAMIDLQKSIAVPAAQSQPSKP